MSGVHQNVVDLVCPLFARYFPGSQMNPSMRKSRTTHDQTSTSSEVSKSHTVVIGFLVKTILSYRSWWSSFRSDLCVEVPNHHLCVIFWATSYQSVQRIIELVFLFVGSIRMRRVYTNDAEVVEASSYTDVTHTLVDWFPVDDALSEIVPDDETTAVHANTRLVSSTVVDVCSVSYVGDVLYTASFPSHLL